jgi:hypothetical protein
MAPHFFFEKGLHIKTFFQKRSRITRHFKGREDMAAEEPIPEDLEIADELIAERRAEAPGETPEDMTPWQRPITGAIDCYQLSCRSSNRAFDDTTDCSCCL